MSTLWSVRLASRAEQDLFEIVQWSATNFGQQQAVAYAETLSLAGLDLVERRAVSASAGVYEWMVARKRGGGS